MRQPFHVDVLTDVSKRRDQLAGVDLDDTFGRARDIDRAGLHQLGRQGAGQVHDAVLGFDFNRGALNVRGGKQLRLDLGRQPRASDRLVRKDFMAVSCA